MDDVTREQMAKQLDEEAAVMGEGTWMVTKDHIAPLLHRAAVHLRADGLRLKAQSEMATTLNEEMEQALSALAAFKREVNRA